MVLIGLSFCQLLQLSANTRLALPIKFSAMALSMGGKQAHETDSSEVGLFNPPVISPKPIDTYKVVHDPVYALVHGPS
jgi:hypothetical protein